MVTGTVNYTPYINSKIMRKITFLFIFFATALAAQNSPTPYCEIADPDDVSVEEITAISLNDVTINNTNSNDALVDFTTTLIAVNPNQTYLLRVYGNTYGDFDTNIVAFIDWNNNGILNDEGEIYEIGTLTNSDGNDGIFVEKEIAIPTTAVGTTRVRITKTYTDEDSVAIVNPCAISFDAFGMGEFPGFGQALDFNLNVSSLSTTTFDAKSLSVYPVPAKNSLTIAYKSPIGSIQIYNQLGQEMYTGQGLGSAVDLDVSNFASGVYIIKLFNDKESKTFKIIKE